MHEAITAEVGGARANSCLGRRGWARAVTLPVYRGESRILFASFADACDGWVAIGGGSCATQGCPLVLSQMTDGGAHWVPVAGDLTSIRSPSPRLPKPNLRWGKYAGVGYLRSGRGPLVTSVPVGKC